MSSVNGTFLYLRVDVVTEALCWGSRKVHLSAIPELHLFSGPILAVGNFALVQLRLELSVGHAGRIL